MTKSAEPSTPSGSSKTQQRRRQITRYKNTTTSPATDSCSLLRGVNLAHSAKLIERLGQVALGTDPWPGDVRLSDIEPLFVCQAYCRRGADVRPDFDGDRKVVGA